MLQDRDQLTKTFIIVNNFWSIKRGYHLSIPIQGTSPIHQFFRNFNYLRHHLVVKKVFTKQRKLSRACWWNQLGECHDKGWGDQRKETHGRQSDRRHRYTSLPAFKTCHNKQSRGMCWLLGYLRRHLCCETKHFSRVELLWACRLSRFMCLIELPFPNCYMILERKTKS